MKLSDKWVKIRLLALDFDGVLTDGYVYFSRDGLETIRCSRKDALGTNMLQEAGVGVVVISKETNLVVEKRCKKMKVDYFYGVDTGEQKLDILKHYISERDILPDEVAYVGDDLNDLPCITFAGLGITVMDGHPDCQRAASYITQKKGGKHAVREVCEIILRAKGVIK